MHIRELSDLTGVPVRSIHRYVAVGIIPRPHGGKCHARYDQSHLDAIRAYQALKHTNTVLKDLSAFLREEGIGIVEYARQREESIRFHGLGVA